MAALPRKKRFVVRVPSANAKSLATDLGRLAELDVRLKEAVGVLPTITKSLGAMYVVA
jgi:hypothetical protein